MRWRYGIRRGRRYDHKEQGVRLTIEWLVDEWERDHGLVAPEESIDRLEQP